MLRPSPSPSPTSCLRSTVDTALRISRQVSVELATAPRLRSRRLGELQTSTHGKPCSHEVTFQVDRTGWSGRTSSSCSLFTQLVLVRRLTHNSHLLGCEAQHTNEWEFWCNFCLARTVRHPCTPGLRDSAAQILAQHLISNASTWLRCVIGYAAVNRSSFWCAPETAI